MIGADDQPPRGARYGELGDHALPRLDITQDEVLPARIADHEAPELERGEHGVGGRLDVDSEHLVGANGVECPLRVAFIGLHAIGQSHGDEPGLVSGLAKLPDGALCQERRCERIHAAADAQHIGGEA
ncbi:hypothetical protein D3C72_2144480 [compost metagenome]